MIFNGLSKSDLVIYNALCDLLQLDPQRPISSYELAQQCSYHQNTVKAALGRLVGWQIVARRRERPGQPYEYKILE